MQAHIAAILMPCPVHYVILPIHTRIQARDCHAGQQTLLAVSREGEALAIQEVDFPVQTFRTNICDLAYAPHGRFIHQQGKISLFLCGCFWPVVDLPIEKVFLHRLQRKRWEPDRVEPMDW